MTCPPFTISPADSSKDLLSISSLFQSYAATLSIDLSFQDFATELATLPGKYSAPSGALLLARRQKSNSDDDGKVVEVDGGGEEEELEEAIGCVALRPLPPPINHSSDHASNESVCEMKRLFVDASARGLGIGKALALAAISAARILGYAKVRLDTLPEMRAAREMYRGLGFVEIAAYYATPVEGTIFLELALGRHD